ncbi:MAG: glycosyltransferase family 2 protein [Nitrososphaerota archaeon]|nr:glycosyltransferase family 2 protein [Nitrososphaerota archaeon]
MDISIFIPIYKESKQVEEMLATLVSQNVSKEIFITVDEPTEEFCNKLRRFEKENVKFIVNHERTGKVNALNSMVSLSTGRVLLFLDSDVDIPADHDYLKKIIAEMQHIDILDIKKRVTKNKSFLSKMAYYEYLTFNINSWLASRFMQRCPAVNGAAFAIQREMFEKLHGFRKVVAEDIDIATRAFLEDSRFAYSQDVEVQTIVHNDWYMWYTQRRRWAIGQALWLKDWYKQLALRFVNKPQVFIPSLFVLYPSATVIFLNVLVPSLWMYNSLLIFSLFLSVKFNIALPIFLVSLATADILKILLISISGFAVTTAVFYGFSRKLGFHEMKLQEMFVYYFFYSAIWMFIIVAGHVQVLLLGKKTGPNWKT